MKQAVAIRGSSSSQLLCYWAMAIIVDDGSLADGSEIPIDPGLNTGVTKCIRVSTGFYNVYPMPPVLPKRSHAVPSYIGSDIHQVDLSETRVGIPAPDTGLCFQGNPTETYTEVNRFNLSGGPENGSFSIEFKSFP